VTSRFRFNHRYLHLLVSKQYRRSESEKRCCSDVVGFLASPMTAMPKLAAHQGKPRAHKSNHKKSRLVKPGKPPQVERKKIKAKKRIVAYSPTPLQVASVTYDSALQDAIWTSNPLPLVVDEKQEALYARIWMWRRPSLPSQAHDCHVDALRSAAG
jgi:hypothetical protein